MTHAVDTYFRTVERKYVLTRLKMKQKKKQTRMLISIVSHHLNFLVLDIKCLAYFRSYGHLKIVKMYRNVLKIHF